MCGDIIVSHYYQMSGFMFLCNTIYCMKKLNEPVQHTGIKISKATCARLVEKGRKGETYDRLINRLLDELERIQDE